MAYQISQNDPDSISTEDLLAEIGSFAVLAAEVVTRLALILKTLHKRRQPHPFFQDRILRFWKSIADGRLSAEAAILLANQNTINAVLCLPPSRQIEIAKGEAIPVAVRGANGAIKSDDMEIGRMGPDMLKVVFGPDGIRTVHEQAQIIMAGDKFERHGMITVLRDEVALKIGNQKIRPEDLKGPLMALGYSLDLLRDTPRKAG